MIPDQGFRLPVQYKGRRTVHRKGHRHRFAFPEYGREAGVGEEWIGTIEKEIAARVEYVRAD